MQFGMLGPLEVVDDGEPVRVGGTKLSTLLAVLLVRGNEVVPVDRLIEDLWEEEPPENATATLHSYVSQLRRALRRGEPERLITRRPGYLLRVAPDELDATRFESLVSEGRRALAEGDAEAAADLLADALALWRGDALAEFEDAPFARGEAVRLSEVREQAAEDRMEAELQLGRDAELVPELEQLIDEQPLRERRWAQLMLALYRANRQADALRKFQDLRHLLGEELGIDPSNELARLEEGILLQQPELLAPPRTPRRADTRARPAPAESPGSSSAVPVVVAAQVGSPFVGRVSELERLRAFGAQVGQDRRGFALVAGEPGIGKTALAATFAHEMSASATTVLWGRCDEEVLTPYQPFVEVLRDWAVRMEPDRLRAALGADAPQIARYVPAVAALVPDMTEVVPVDVETERFRWFESVASVLATMTASRPGLLVLDDLQWADRPTLQLLRHVLRQRGTIRLLVVATVRPYELGGGDGIAEMLAELRREVDFERIELSGLDVDAVSAMLEAEAARPLGVAGQSLARAIHEETRGNPFFVTEFTRHLSETGVLARLDETTSIATIEKMGIPAGVRDVVATRIKTLSTSSRELLVLGAVLGPDFDPEVLRRVADTDLEAVVDALDEAERAGIVVPIGSAYQYGFSHAIVREALYADVSAVRRQAIHQRITGVLESLHREHPDEHLASLAYHACRAVPLVDPLTAIDYARRAGDQAASQVAYEVAASHYQRALEVLDDAGLRDESLQCQLLLALGEAHNRAGDVTVGKEAFRAAAEIATELDRPDLLLRAALGYGGPVGAVPELDDPRTVDLLDAALVALGDGPSGGRALALGRLAQWLYLVGDRARRSELCDEAIAIAREIEDPATLAVVLHSRYWALYGPDDVDERLEVSAEIAAIGEQLGEPELVVQGTQCRLHALIERGDAVAAREAATLRTELARKLRQPNYLWAVVAYDAMVAATEGRLDEAEQFADAAFAMRRRTDPVSATIVYVAQMQQIRWLQGRMGELIGMHEGLMARDPSRPTWVGALAWARAESGDLAGAAAHLDALAEQGFEQMPRNLEWFPTVGGLAIACQRLGDVERAAQLYELLLPYANRNCAAGQSAFYGAVSHHLGTLAAMIGRADDAVRHFDAALLRHQEFRSAPFIEMTEREIAALG